MNENVMDGEALRNANSGTTVQERNPTGSGSAAKRTRLTASAISGALLLAGAMVAPLCAQPYPSKSIRLVIPVTPGSGADIVGRLLGQKLAEQLGQPVVSDNRPGAGGNVGIETVAKARPDGYTIIIVTAGLTISPSIYKKLNYDPIKDLAPIAMFGRMQNLLLISPSLPVKNLKEFVDYAKANPGKLNFGSSGVGTPGHLASELFKSLAQINITHVPYKGLNAAIVGMIGNEISMMVSNVSTAMPHIRAGKVNAVAVLGNERLPSLPNVPTAKEAGIDNLEVVLWWGILAPAGTPREIVTRLNAELIKIAAMPDIKENLQNVGVESSASTPEQLSKFIKAEIARWAKVIKEANIATID